MKDIAKAAIAIAMLVLLHCFFPYATEEAETERTDKAIVSVVRNAVVSLTR